MKHLLHLLLLLLSALGVSAHIPRATLEMTPGAHELKATAKHPSGQFTTNASVWFTNSVGNLTETNTFDLAGNVTQRIWRNSNGTTNRLQTFTWDGLGRLFKVSDRIIQRSNTVAQATNGVDFTATYDPFGRLLRTVEVVITNSVALTAQPMVIDRTFDPEYEFLEVAVTEHGKTTWKLMGPDMDGVYGGQNGTGGFEAIVPGPKLFCPIISDGFGNLHAVYDQTHGSLTWYLSRLTGYGAVAGYRPVTLGTASADLGAKYAWRNRAQSSIGYVWMGATWLKPDLGETLSFDPYGYDSSDTGHTPFRGNPWSIWDADGRLGVAQYQGGMTFAEHLAGIGGPDYSGMYFGQGRAGFRNRLDYISGTQWEPLPQPSFASRAGHFAADAFLNFDLIGQSWNELSNPDFSTGVGWATFATAGVGIIVGPIDAAANILTLGGKGAVQGGVKAGLREAAEVGTKETGKTIAGGGVKALETGAYGTLQAREVVGDALAHHEIPSFAAIRTAREALLGRELTSGERRALRAENTAIEIPNSVHSELRTTGGKNTRQQFTMDAADLTSAARQDMQQLIAKLQAAGYSREAIAKAMREVRMMNRNRGL